MENKMLKETTSVLSQIDTLVKNYNSLLADKVMEGDVTSSSIVFSNSLIISSIKKLFEDHEELRNKLTEIQEEAKNKNLEKEDLNNFNLN